MSGGNFLVSLREKTLLCKSLLKEGNSVLEEILEDTHHPSEMKKFYKSFLKIFDEAVKDNIALCKGSKEVAITISGYIAKNYVYHLWRKISLPFYIITIFLEKI